MKDLVSSGMHITPASRAHVFVVTTAHSNIPVTSQPDQKLSKNQPVQCAAIVKLPAKHLASSPLQVKASNDESPTIVTPIIMDKPDGAGEQAHSAPPGETAPWSPHLAVMCSVMGSTQMQQVSRSSIQILNHTHNHQCLSVRVSMVEALVMYLDIDNQLGLFQNNFDSNLEVFTRDTLIAIVRYMDVGVCKV